jgi:hypothetical protein
MKMIDMKISEKDRPKPIEAPSQPAMEEYPYGLRLNFDNSDCEKIPELKKLKVGEKVSIQAIAEVMETKNNNDPPKFHVQLQIKKIACDSENSYDEAWKESSKEREGDIWSRAHERAEREEASIKVV